VQVVVVVIAVMASALVLLICFLRHQSSRLADPSVGAVGPGFGDRRRSSLRSPTLQMEVNELYSASAGPSPSAIAPRPDPPSPQPDYLVPQPDYLVPMPGHGRHLVSVSAGGNLVRGAQANESPDSGSPDPVAALQTEAAYGVVVTGAAAIVHQDNSMCVGDTTAATAIVQRGSPAVPGPPAAVPAAADAPRYSVFNDTAADEPSVATGAPVGAATHEYDAQPQQPMYAVPEASLPATVPEPGSTAEGGLGVVGHVYADPDADDDHAEHGHGGVGPATPVAAAQDAPPGTAADDGPTQGCAAEITLPQYSVFNDPQPAPGRAAPRAMGPMALYEYSETEPDVNDVTAGGGGTYAVPMEASTDEHDLYSSPA